MSALGLADFCQRLEPGAVAEWMQKWTYDLVALASGADVRYNIEHEKRMALLAQKMSRLELLRFYSTLVSLKAIAEHPLNPRLYFDDLFINYKELA